jgi:hypothetical protein
VADPLSFVVYGASVNETKARSCRSQHGLTKGRYQAARFRHSSSGYERAAADIAAVEGNERDRWKPPSIHRHHLFSIAEIGGLPIFRFRNIFEPWLGSSKRR